MNTILQYIPVIEVKIIFFIQLLLAVLAIAKISRK